MTRVCQIEIQQSAEVLKQLRDEQKSVISYQKLHALYLLKTQQVPQVQKVATAIGVHRVTVQKWLKRYRERGLDGLVRVRHRGGGPSLFTSAALDGLKQRLSEATEGFNSYGEVQHWLDQHYQVKAAYPTVHALVRYKLRSKLKVARPVSAQQDPQAVEAFKKL